MSAVGAAASATLLSTSRLTRRFGGVAAVDDLEVQIHSGETLGVIGPNGAGKSTLVGLLSGALRPSGGSIVFAGRDITRTAAPARSKAGIGRTHQIPRPFVDMTVRENLLLALRYGVGTRRGPARARADEILALTGLDDVADISAGKLGLLRRKRLELARALALQPRLLLLDEIGAGLVESETRELIALIQGLRGQVESILLIEHVLDVITSCCDRLVVLNFGRLLTAGAPAAVLRDPHVAAVYLGTAATPTEEAVDTSVPEGLSDGAPAGDLARPALLRGTHTTEPLLRVEHIAVRYGEARALLDVSLTVQPGEVVTLLGANGAGKTTTARAISGMVKLEAGEVHFAGERISGQPAEAISAAGLAHCMEGRRIFADLSVEDNLLLAAHRADRAERRRRLDEVYALFEVLHERRGDSGTAMSGGQQQMLAIGRALMAAPSLVIFDEISLGLAPVAVERLYEALEHIRREGVAILVVEQNIERGLSLADHAYVLSAGRTVLNGPPPKVRTDPELRALYLGETTDDDPHR